MEDVYKRQLVDVAGGFQAVARPGFGMTKGGGEIPWYVFELSLIHICFLREAKARSGRFIFDRAFWAWRHLACRLFRLGTLEFEYRAAGADEPLPSGIGPGTPVLSVHIPSDARLSDDALPGSYGQADEFFALHGPALCKSGMPRAVLCGTWLLSPALRADVYKRQALKAVHESSYACVLALLEG